MFYISLESTIGIVFIYGKKDRSSLLYLVDTNRQGLQARITLKVMQKY